MEAKPEGEGAQALAVQGQQNDAFLQMQVPLAVIQERVHRLQEFTKSILEEGTDYGVVEGIKTPFLHKPGAEKLCLAYGLRPEYEVTDSSNMGRTPPLIDFNVVCRLYSQKSGIVRGEGVGNCNSLEEKFRYRWKKRVCPDCKQETIRDSKEGGGWYCWKKIGGCGRQYGATDPRLVDQKLGRVENEDVAGLKNTILKQAKKRAYVDATLTATAASGLFTQDPEAVGGKAPDDPGEVHDVKPEPEHEVVEASPKCPDCGGEMKKRSRKDGKGEFWGCKGYPKCRGILNVGGEPKTDLNALPDTNRILAAFGGLGVSEAELTERVGKPPMKWNEEDIEFLRKAYSKIRMGDDIETAFTVQETIGL